MKVGRPLISIWFIYVDPTDDVYYTLKGISINKCEKKVYVFVFCMFNIVHFISSSLQGHLEMIC